MSFLSTMQIRFADVDKLGHVNNAKYLTYCEQARMDYFDHLFGKGGINWKENGFILARAETDFITPVFLEDEVTVLTTCERIGTKSFDLRYRIQVKRDGKSLVAVDSISVLVAYDYQEGNSMILPVAWRKKLQEELEADNLQRVDKI